MANNYVKLSKRDGSGRVRSRLFFFDDNSVSDARFAVKVARNEQLDNERISVYRMPKGQVERELGSIPVIGETP